MVRKPAGDGAWRTEQQAGYATETFHIPDPGTTESDSLSRHGHYRSKSVSVQGTQKDTLIAKKAFDNTNRAPIDTRRREEVGGRIRSLDLGFSVEFRASEGELQ